MKKWLFVSLMIISAMFFAVACGDNPDSVDVSADKEKETADTEAKADSDDEADTDSTGDEANSGNEEDGEENGGDTDTDTGDTDTGDTDTDTGDTDTGDTDTDTGDTDTVAFDPCDPNKCLNDAHSDGICTPYPSEAELYSCGCVADADNNNYQWYSGKCYKVVSQHRCQLLAKLAEESFPLPDWATSALEFVCYCFSPDTCLALWEP